MARLCPGGVVMVLAVTHQHHLEPGEQGILRLQAGFLFVL